MSELLGSAAILGLIPARRGSRGVPEKNLRPLGGKPLLLYTVEAALSSSRLSAVVLSTEDSELAELGRSAGAEVPFIRPAILAADNTPMIEVVEHAVLQLEKAGRYFDAVCLLQPTTPFRTGEEIDIGIKLFLASKADTLISVSPLSHDNHPFFVYLERPDGHLEPSSSGTNASLRRQELPRAYRRSGSLYITRTQVIKQRKSLYGDAIIGFPTPFPERHVNIDSEADWKQAEELASSHPLTTRAFSLETDSSLPTCSIGQTQAGSPNIDPPVRLLVTESEAFSDTAFRLLSRAVTVELSDIRHRDDLVERVRNVEILWVRLRHRIDREIFDAAPKLIAIVSPTTGLDHIDLEEARRRSIEVLSLNGEGEFLKTIRATVEYTIALILTALRHIPAACRRTLAGRFERDFLLGTEISGKVIGVVGCGRIGRMVTEHFLNFGASVLVSDPALAVSDLPPGARLVALDELLRSSDLVTLHAALTDGSTGLIGRRELDLLKPHVWLVNTARGGLIDEEALLWSLEGGKIAGAALDVLACEQSVDAATHPFVTYAAGHDNLIITPHIGGYTRESLARTELFLADKLRSWLSRCMCRADRLKDNLISPQR